MKLPKLPKNRAVCRMYSGCDRYLSSLCRQACGGQIVRGEEFHQIALSNKTDTIELSAPGEILDKDGVVLAGNKTTSTWSITLLKWSTRRAMQPLLKVVALLEERGEKWVDRLPIELDEEGTMFF